MRTSILTAIVALGLASHSPALAASAKPAGIVSPPLSINPLEGQPLCLVSNQSPTATISVKAEIVDVNGVAQVSATLDIPPKGIDAITDVLSTFYSYCRVTPLDAANVPLVRASHCIASGNTSRTCVEAR
jgi:hypothetical protein